MQNSYDNSTFGRVAECLTIDTRNVSDNPPTNNKGYNVAIFDDNDGSFFDCLRPFDYEAYLRREGLAS